MKKMGRVSQAEQHEGVKLHGVLSELSEGSGVSGPQCQVGSGTS